MIFLMHTIRMDVLNDFRSINGKDLDCHETSGLLVSFTLIATSCICVIVQVIVLCIEKNNCFPRSLVRGEIERIWRGRRFGELIKPQRKFCIRTRRVKMWIVLERDSVYLVTECMKRGLKEACSLSWQRQALIWVNAVEGERKKEKREVLSRSPSLMFSFSYGKWDGGFTPCNFAQHEILRLDFVLPWILFRLTQRERKLWREARREKRKLDGKKIEEEKRWKE